jgi:ankyrin repeat protein
VAVAPQLDFYNKTEAHLRQWVEANPGRVNEQDRQGFTPLYVAARKHTRLLVVWLIDENGADPNTSTLLHVANSLAILIALLDRGADPSGLDGDDSTPLMIHALFFSSSQHVYCVIHLLKDPRVRATINVQNCVGETAIHQACFNDEDDVSTFIIHLLLQARANPLIRNMLGETPLDCLRQLRPSHRTSIALLEQAEK